MTPDLSQILSQALALPDAARAALAGALLESLGESVDEDAEIRWAAEIARRIAELDRPQGNVLAWPE